MGARERRRSGRQKKASESNLPSGERGGLKADHLPTERKSNTQPSQTLLGRQLTSTVVTSRDGYCLLPFLVYVRSLIGAPFYRRALAS